MASAVISWKARWGNFSLLLMIAFSFAQLVLLLLGIRWLAPTLWRGQVAMGCLALVEVVVSYSASNAVLEFFVHRYMLHETVVSWLEEVTRRHRKHHALTLIMLAQSLFGEGLKVRSKFPIVEPKQWEYVNFRDSLLVIFYGVNILPLAFVQWLSPHLPIIIGGYVAITISYSLYEVLHVIEHKPDAWWEQKSQLSFLWCPFDMLRRFHQYHHLYPKYNMAIAGFFGIPIADVIFGTFRLPARPLVHGLVVNDKDLRMPIPSRFIIWLDAWVQGRQRNF